MVTGYNPVTSVTRAPLSGRAVTGVASARQKPIKLTTAPYSTRMAKVSPALRSQRRTRFQIVRGDVPSGTSTRLRERSHVIGSDLAVECLRVRGLLRTRRDARVHS